MVLVRHHLKMTQKSRKVKVNRVDAKPISNNYEGDVLVNNLLERYSSCKKLKRYCIDLENS